MKLNADRCRFFIDDISDRHADKNGGSSVVLRALHGMSTHHFHFPFAGIGKVREALKFRFRPLLGDSASGISIVPFFAIKDRKSSSGCVFLLPRAESDDDRDGAEIIWPAPLAFASRVGGSGVITFVDGEQIATMWIDDWIPKYSEVSSADETTVEESQEGAVSFAASSGIAVTERCVVDVAELSDEELQLAARESLHAFPAYAMLDLSDRETNILERREKISSSILRYTRVMLSAGIIALLAAGAAYLHISSTASEISDSAQTVYFNAFGERSAQPLSSARAKLRTDNGTEGSAESLSLADIVRSLTGSWQEFTPSDDIAIETVRYGQENTDIVGTSSTNEMIQKLRTSLENDGLFPQIDNIQRIPSGQLRFNISITRSPRS